MRKLSHYEDQFRKNRDVPEASPPVEPSAPPEEHGSSDAPPDDKKPDEPASPSEEPHSSPADDADEPGAPTTGTPETRAERRRLRREAQKSKV